ncbi:MAG: hypothetical protein KY468_13625 [Armatimonadetes bacterium]|nr:hypothetical protein [Armatimonadota bacterium]
MSGCNPQPESPEVSTAPPAAVEGPASMVEGSPSAVAVNITENPYLFKPAAWTVEPGTVITWNHLTDVPHTVISDPGTPPGGPNSDGQFPEGLKKGDAYSWTVPDDAKPGTTWFYHCRFHGKPGDGKSLGTGMVGTIQVKPMK